MEVLPSNLAFLHSNSLKMQYKRNPFTDLCRNENDLMDIRSFK
jgi:hypothetical protein